MKLANLEIGNEKRLGVLDGGTARLLPAGTDAIEMLALGPAERERRAAAATETVALAEAKLLAPLRPPAVRDFVAFEQHIEGMVMTEGPGTTVPAEWYQAPAFYFSNPNAIFAAGDEIEVPPGCEALDYECEVGAIIGRRGRDLTVENAREHIAGYTIFNDWSARDLQGFDLKLKMGWAKGKDFASTLGPWIVTADELEPYRDDEGRLDLEMSASLNGETLGTDSLASAAWTFEQMLVYASRGCELVPGDLIGSGTCGSGCLGELWGRGGRREPPPLAPGDEVTLSVEGIGTITNTIVAGVGPIDYGAPRRR